MTDDRDPRLRRVDSAQLVRQWAILKLLSSSNRSFTVKELAEQFGVTKPTIQRDLATLSQQFALIEEQEGAQRRSYRIDQRIRALESITFLPLELLAIHAAASAAAMAGTPFAEELRDVGGKIRGFLSERHNGFLNSLSRVFAPHRRGEIDYGDHGELILDLTDAIARRRKCRGVYHAAWRDTVKEHTFRPLRLVWHRGSLYLLCVLDGLSEVTTLAVHRFRSLEPTGETFPPPKKIDVDAHIRRAFGIFVSQDEEDVEILFDSEIAWRVAERTHHPDETTERQPDGSLLYRVRSSAQWEIVPWVLSFGGLAELRRPQSWRDAIADAIEAMRGRYAG